MSPTTRVLTNIQTLLKVGLFQGQNHGALQEAMDFVEHLLHESELKDQEAAQEAPKPEPAQ